MKQGALVFQVEEKLWVPLHSNKEVLSGVLNGLHDTVKVPSRNNQSVANAINALTVQAVDARAPAAEALG